MSFTNDQQGRVLERVEADYTYSQSDPRERRYRFNGIEMGVVGNNGADDTDYATAIARRNAASGTGAFRGGAAYGTPFADFDQNYAGVNPSNERGTGSMWTARAGDTLSGIASAVFGDASRWYLIAEANGLGGNGPQGALSAGTSIVIPGGSAATNLFNNANTFKPYDPAKAIGDTQPNAPAPPRGNNGCGVFGQILLAVVAVAVTILALPSGGASVGIGQGILAGLAGGVASNVVGLATGIQDSIDWKGIALGAIGGGVTAALGPATGFFATALRAAAASAITQGIGLATGLQDEFDWTGVAAAGVGSYIGGRIGAKVSGSAGRVVAATASGLANAATRSLIDGTDFGDNLRSALPDVIGQTVGGAIGNRINRAIAKVENGSGGGSGKIIVNQGAISEAASNAFISPEDRIAQDVALGRISPSEGQRLLASVTELKEGLSRKFLASASTKQYQVLSDGVDFIDHRSLDRSIAANTPRTATGDAKVDRDKFTAAVAANRQRIYGYDVIANAAINDAMRTVLPPLDLWLSGSAIANGNASWTDYASVTFAVLPAAGKAAGAVSLFGKVAEGGTPLMRGIAFENSGVAAARAGAFLPGESVRRLSVRAFDDAGNLLPGRTVLDLAGNRGAGQLGALEFKLHKGVVLTERQAQHFPDLATNGGIVVGNNGRDLGLFNLDRIGPLKVQRIDGPALPLTWWPK